MRTTLFINHYAHPNEERRRETDECLARNIANPEIDRIVALVTSRSERWGEFDLSGKVTWEEVDCRKYEHGRPTFRMYFDAVNRHTGADDLNIVANADIWFDETIRRVKPLDLDGVCLALTRWEAPGDREPKIECWHNSQDVWCFQGRIKPLGWVDFPMGAWGCDNRLSWQLRHDDYIVLNPCRSIRAMHYHASGVRNVARNVGGNRDTVSHRAIEECGLALRPASVFRGVLAYCLYGTNPKYNIGAVRNAILAKHLYPEWTMRVYHDDSVPGATIESLCGLHVELVRSPGVWSGIDGMFARLLAADEPGYTHFVMRDADSRLSYRERRAVDQWLESGRDFHVMRDHPHHVRLIIGAAWGGRTGNLRMSDRIRRWVGKTKYGDDERLLQNEVWPIMQNRLLLHSDYPAPGAVPFPVRREKWRFIAERCHEDECWQHDDRKAIYEHRPKS